MQSNVAGVGPIAIPQPTGIHAEPWSARKLWGLLKSFGPAAIVASISVGAGETIVVVRAGAWAKYDLLWLVLLAAVTKGLFVTYLLGRYAVMSGEGIASRLVRLPGPRGWMLIALVVLELLFAPFGWTPMAKACGTLLQFLLRDWLPPSLDVTVGANALSTAFILFAMGLSFSTSFKSLEKQQIIICGILVAGTVTGTLMVKPDWWQSLLGCVRVGHVPAIPDWAPDEYKQNAMLNLARDYSYVGGSVFTYLAYASWVRMHGWGLMGHERAEAIQQRAAASPRLDYLPEDADSVRRVRLLASPLRWDAGMGAFVLFFVTGAFMMSGAAVLYREHSQFKNWDLLTSQAGIWENIHPLLIYVYYVVIAAALWGTLQALPEMYARVTTEFVGAVAPRLQFSLKKVQLAVCAWVFVGTQYLIWNNVSFDTISQVAGLMLANVGLALAAICAIYLNFQLPTPYRTRWYMLAGILGSAAVLVTASCLHGWGLWLKFAGT